MKNRRENILLVSREMFNDLGYRNVTIRMIALKLKMSSGNLNYYFKKREDVLEALYFEMVSDFDSRIARLDEMDVTFETINKNILWSMQRMIEYRFFWTDLYHLLQLNSKIKSHFETVYKNRFNGYQLLFCMLIERKYLERFEFAKEREFLIERMIGFSNTWIYNSHLYHKEIDQNYIVMQANNLLSMLYPYFTDLGKGEYKKLVPNSFV